MLKLSVMLLHVAVAAVSFWSVSCLSEDDKSAFMKALKPLAMDCVHTCGLKEDEKPPMKSDDIDPCFKKCFLKKVGILNDEDKYNREDLRKDIEEFTDNKEIAEKMQDRMDTCFDEKTDNEGDDEEAVMKRVDVLFECINHFKS